MTTLFMMGLYLLVLLQLQAYFPWLPWLIVVCFGVRYAYKTGVINMPKYRKYTNFDEVVAQLNDAPKSQHEVILNDERIAKLRAISEEHIFGQDQVVNQVVEKIIANSEIPNRDRPIISALLVGPPGVGKTKFAEHVSNAVSNHPQRLLRIDSSQYKDHDSSSLFGTGKGYVGSDSLGSISNWLKMEKIGTVVVDEVDRVQGNPRAWTQSYMSYMEGKATEVSTQQEFHTRDTMIFYTTNSQCDKLGELAEKYKKLEETKSQAELNAAMRKEAMAILEGPVFDRAFLDRVDVIGLFLPLSREVMADIVLRESTILAAHHGIELEAVQKL